MLQRLKGFRDFYPEDMAERNHVFAAMRRVARRFGFVEYDGPPLESLELFTKKSGDEIVHQLYHFTDKGGREVALRPEMTPTLARMVAARANSLPKPIKWFTIPQLFRYERSQRGRLREHFQLNVDIVGASELEADAELLAVALEVQRELGLTKDDVVARVNDRRIVAEALRLLGVAPEHFGAAYAALDKFHKVPHETFAELLAKASVSPQAITELQELCAGKTRVSEWFAPRLGDVGEEARKTIRDLDRYVGLMEDYGLQEMVEVDFSIVRGLAYYTGIVFELYDQGGKERAICGGGRYDDLIHSVGGPDLPALGFGMGDVVLSLMLRDRGLMPEPPPPAEVVVIPVGAEMARPGRLVAKELRALGIRTEIPYARAGVGKELKAAGQRRIPVAVIVGPDEWAEKKANVKDLRTGEQECLPLVDIPAHVRAATSSTSR